MLVSIIVLLLMAILVASKYLVVYLARKKEDERFEALVYTLVYKQVDIEEADHLIECIALANGMESNRAYTRALHTRLAYLAEFDDTDKEEILEAVRNPYEDPIGKKHKEELAGLLNTQIGDFAS